MKCSGFTALFLVLLLCGGCIGDSTDDCPRNKIIFSYEGDIEEECLLRYIGRVNLYIYDENGTLAASYVRDEAALKAWPGVELDLPPGEYHAVCWGNVYEYSQVDKEASLQEAVIAPPRYFRGEMPITSDSLYFGIQKIRIEKESWLTDTVSFRNAHVKMRVNLCGLDPEICGNDCKPVNVRVGEVRTAMDFNQERHEETTFYLPVLEYDEEANEYYARFNLPRFPNDNIIDLHLDESETEDLIYEIELKDFISRYELCVESRQEVAVAIRFRFNKSKVTIEPWKEEEIKPGM